MSRHDSRKLLMWTLVVLMAAGLTGCAALKPEVGPINARSELPPRKVEMQRITYLGVPCFLHEVRWPEESLSAIARWYTGSENNARILAKVTPNLRETDLRKGDVIFIPLELSRRSDPLPRSYARRHGKAPEPAKRTDSKTTPPVKDDFPDDDQPPVPYGPREFPE